MQISPIANYVFTYYLNREFVTDSGIVNPKSDNSIIESHAGLESQVWNEMVLMNEEIVNWLIENSETYEVDGIEYPNWYNVTVLVYKNRFSI